MRTSIACICLMCLVLPLGALDWSARNQLALTLNQYLQKAPDKADLRAWWQPELDLTQKLGADYDLAGQFSGQLTVRKTFHYMGESSDLKTKAYRLWLKVEKPQTSARLGLQRINFGSAQILRPLQWFDNLDPTDALEQTRGVQALLIQHYFLNNANIWLWGIRGEGILLGQNQTITTKGTPEAGGRFQYPLTHGEAALTFNHRQSTVFGTVKTGSEDRLGFDAKLDLGPGVWVEGYLSHTQHPVIISRWQAPLTLGVENTFGLGNGIYTLAEVMLLHETEADLSTLRHKSVTYAFAANYPLSILDKMLYFAIVKADRTVSSHTLLWRRDYDKLSWDLGVFWDAGTAHRSYNSRGIRLVLSYTF